MFRLTLIVAGLRLLDLRGPGGWLMGFLLLTRHALAVADYVPPQNATDGKL